MPWKGGHGAKDENSERALKKKNLLGIITGVDTLKETGVETEGKRKDMEEPKGNYYCTEGARVKAAAVMMQVEYQQQQQQV